MVSYNNKQIDYTFKYGGYVSKKTKIVLIILPAFLILLGLTIFVILLLNNENGAWGSLILCFLGLTFLLINLCLFIKIKHRDKEILNWITDENIIEFKTTAWEFSNKLVGFTTYYRFGIDFDINDKQFRKISLNYDAYYKHIKGTIITGLYSQKFDEVMLLKG